jgi:uncharacterized damage-inducible protein DinB
MIQDSLTADRAASVPMPAGPANALHTALHTHDRLIRYKQWADQGLYDVLAETFDRLQGEDATNVLRALDHIQAVDRIFQHHLQGLPHCYGASVSRTIPSLPALAEAARDVDDWYVSHVAGMTPHALAQKLEFAYTNGEPGHMTRGDILLHVCTHGIYHCGNVGVILLKNGIRLDQVRLNDFLLAA